MQGIELHDLLNQANVASSTLRKYIQLGLIERPTVQRKGAGNVTSIYPADTLLKIELINELKQKNIPLSKMKAPMLQALVAAKTRQFVEQAGIIKRSQKTPSINWLQAANEALLIEAGISPKEIYDQKLIAILRLIEVRRNRDGQIEAIEIKVDDAEKRRLDQEVRKHLDLRSEIGEL